MSSEDQAAPRLPRVHARFSLTEIARVTCYVKGEEGQNWVPTEGARVKLNAIQGEPFGSATPNGSVEMVIANPVAARLFLSAPLGQHFDFLISQAEA